MATNAVVQIPLYAAALGLIPALLSFAYDRKVFHQTILGNRLVAFVILGCAALGFISALIVLVRNRDSVPLNVGVVVGIAVPAAAIFVRIGAVVIRSQRIDAVDAGDTAPLVAPGRELGDQVEPVDRGDN